MIYFKGIPSTYDIRRISTSPNSTPTLLYSGSASMNSILYPIKYLLCFLRKSRLSHDANFVTTGMFRVMTNTFSSLKRKCRHFDEIVISGCTESCQNDNFQCSQWRKFHQNNISAWVFVPVTTKLASWRLSVFSDLLWICYLFIVDSRDNFTHIIQG